MEDNSQVLKNIVVDDEIFIIRGMQVMIFQTTLRDLRFAP